MSKKQAAPAGPADGISKPYTDAAGYLFCKAGGRKVRFGRADDPKAQKEYQAFVGHWVVNGCRWPDETEPEDLDIQGLAGGFLRHAGTYYGPGHKELARIEVALRRWVAFTGGRTKASEFDGKAFVAFRRALIDEGLAAATVRVFSGVVSRAVRWAVLQNLVPAECWQRIQAAPSLRVGREGVRPPKVRKPVPPEAIAAVLHHLPGPLAIAVQVLALCGARPTELLALRVGDIDRTGKVWTATLERHKNASKGKARVLCFGPRAQELLRPLLSFDRNAYLFDPERAEDERKEKRKAGRRTPRWASHNPDLRRKRRGAPARTFTEHYTHGALGKALRRAITEVNEKAKRDAIGDALRRAGVASEVIRQATTRLSRRPVTTETAKGVLLGDEATAGHATDALAALDRVVLLERWCAYELRHTAATTARREASVEAARALLGHSSASMTGHYAELDLGLAVAVAERLG